MSVLLLQAIKAFEEAVSGMTAGGIRRIEVPGSKPELGYSLDRKERFTDELISPDLKIYKWAPMQQLCKKCTRACPHAVMAAAAQPRQHLAGSWVRLVLGGCCALQLVLRIAVASLQCCCSLHPACTCACIKRHAQHAACLLIMGHRG